MEEDQARLLTAEVDEGRVTPARDGVLRGAGVGVWGGGLGGRHAGKTEKIPTMQLALFILQTAQDKEE